MEYIIFDNDQEKFCELCHFNDDLFIHYNITANYIRKRDAIDLMT